MIFLIIPFSFTLLLFYLFTFLPFQQFLLCLCHSFEIEAFEHIVHQGIDFVVTQIADRTLVGMMDVVVGMECASLNLQSHLFICIAERHACSSKAVHLFYREDRERICSFTSILLMIYAAICKQSANSSKAGKNTSFIICKSRK